ncbi:MAG: serine hydrolase domain-containing protein [Candidatus Hodarchaeota archaeon]
MTERDAQSSVIPEKNLLAFEPIRSKVLSLIDNEKIPSMAIAVAKDGEIIWQEAFGFADKEKNLLATVNSIYPVGSMAKSITATGLMVLVDRGKVNLSDPVEKYLPKNKIRVFEGNSNDLTVKSVLNMSGGIPHGWLIYNESAKSLFSTETLSESAISVFPPGEEEYSNFSYAIPEFLIEEVMQQSFSDFMQSSVFRPLGMMHSSFHFVKNREKDFTTRYGAELETLPQKYQAPVGSANFYCSIHDVIRYALFHLKQLPDQTNVIRDETLDIMHSVTGKATQNAIFGLGWGILDIEEGIKCLISNGRVSGGSSALMIIPSKNLAIACLLNMSTDWVNPYADNIVFEIADLFVPNFSEKLEKIQESFETENSPKPYEPSPSLLGEWDGYLLFKKEIPVQITFNSEGGIHLRVEKQKDQELNNAAILKDYLMGSLKKPLSIEELPENNKVSIKLKIEDQRIYGYMSIQYSTEQAYISIPYYIHLERQW